MSVLDVCSTSSRITCSSRLDSDVLWQALRRVKSLMSLPRHQKTRCVHDILFAFFAWGVISMRKHEQSILWCAPLAGVGRVLACQTTSSFMSITTQFCAQAALAGVWLGSSHLGSPCISRTVVARRTEMNWLLHFPGKHPDSLAWRLREIMRKTLSWTMCSGWAKCLARRRYQSWSLVVLPQQLAKSLEQLR